MTLYNPAEATLERCGRMVLERDRQGYYHLADYDKSGGSHSNCVGNDEAEAREAWAALVARGLCKVCGTPKLGEWEKNTKKQMDERDMCFSCNHWTNNVAAMGPDVAVIEGRIYSIGEEDRPRESSFRGHGGAKFVIEFFDGRVVTTTNLWAGGEIPDEFRAQLPDNARFVKREHSHAYVGAGSASCPDSSSGMDVA